VRLEADKLLLYIRKIAVADWSAVATGAYAPSSFCHAFTCQAKHAGVIRVDPDGDPCPPYSITFNQVSSYL
jgi:hypothetical protein